MNEDILVLPVMKQKLWLQTNFFYIGNHKKSKVIDFRHLISLPINF